MIEYKHDNYWQDVTYEMIHLQGGVEDISFSTYVLRMNGKEYSENTDEFKEAFKKQIVWEMLRVNV